MIEKVEIYYVKRPLEKKFGLGKFEGAITSLDFLGVNLYTDDGMVGYGESGSLATIPALEKILDPLKILSKKVIGKDPFAVAQIWDELFSTTQGFWSGAPEIIGALSGIDIAMYDLIGKYSKQPIFKLFGGSRNRVPVYASGGYYIEGKNKEPPIEEITSYVDKGFKAVKMKVGRLNPEDDAFRVKKTREAIGEDILLACDANKGYTVQEAIKFGKLVEKYNIRWFEEPVHWYDYLKGGKRVRDAISPTSVATGESLYSEYDARDLVEWDGADILQVDACGIGGITPWLRLAGLSKLHGMYMAPHHTHIVHPQLVAAIPNGLTVEYFPNDVRDPITRNIGITPPEIRNQEIVLGLKPGLGFEPNQEFIQKYQTYRTVIT